MKPLFRVIIAGSRSFSDIELMRLKCDAILKAKVDTHEIVIVSGTAGGTDKLGEQYASERGYKVHRYPAKWDEFGRRAGYIRNQQMMDNADAVIVFWDGVSKGSRHMMDIAEAANAPLRVVRF